MIDDLLERLRPISSVWQTSSPGFASQQVPAALHERLPRDYLALMESLGSGEGFLGIRYLRLYPLDSLVGANHAYGVAEWLPDHQIFGSDGCGNAFLFDLRTTPARVVEVPFIPLDPEFIADVHDDFARFFAALGTVPSGYAGPLPRTPNPETLGLEVHEKHPVVLGGNPTDPANKVLLAPPEHAKASMFFNRLFREVRAQSRQS